MADRAIRLGMGPMLLHILREIRALGDLPPDIGEVLEKSYYLQGLYNAKALAELAGILAEMEREGLSPIVLKGAALAGRSYSNVALRSLRLGSSDG